MADLTMDDRGRRHRPLTTLERRFTCALVLASTLSLGLATTPSRAAAKPNVVIIVADDMGHGDVTIDGGDVPTPRIDSIGKAGIRFTAGYVTAPVCNPSRAGLMTGRYQQRWGQELNDQTAPPDGAPRNSLPQVERTLATALRAEGYRTGAIGKWHLGMQPGYHPMDRGFEEFFGMASGTHYIDRSWPGVHVFENLIQFDRSEPPGDGESEDPARLARRGLWRGREPAPLLEYVTDQLAKEAVSFIDRHRAEPFFLYVAFNAPHAPLETTDVYYQRFPQFEDERKRIHAAMISALDDGVGRILDALDATGKASDTVVVFVSDNGGPDVTDADGRCNAPFIGHKRYLYEGGIREPFMIGWPAGLRGERAYAELVSTLDLFPTVLAAVSGAAASGGAAAPPSERPLDGVDLLPYLRGDKTGAPHDLLFWRSGPNGAVRQGRYKLIVGGVSGKVARLYDLESDPRETTDLSTEMPERVAAMKKAWETWNAQLSPARSSARTVTTDLNGDAFRWHI
jgi:arylsulfatase A-like enzyme